VGAARPTARRRRRSWGCSTPRPRQPAGVPPTDGASRPPSGGGKGGNARHRGGGGGPPPKLATVTGDASPPRDDGGGSGGGDTDGARWRGPAAAPPSAPVGGGRCCTARGDGGGKRPRPPPPPPPPPPPAAIGGAARAGGGYPPGAAASGTHGRLAGGGAAAHRGGPSAAGGRSQYRPSGSSLHEANQQITEQKCLFGNRQTKADLLVRLVGEQSPNIAPFCSPVLLTSLEGKPCMCIGPHERNVSNPEPNEEPGEVAPTQLKIQLPTNACSYSQKVRKYSRKTAQRSRMSGNMQSPCQTSR